MILSTKKNKKRIAIIVLMIFICYYLLLILGVFPYPKMAVKLFFKANISRFEDTEYMMLNNDDPSDKLYSLPSYEYENNTVDHNFNTFLIMYLGQYESIEENNGDVDFRLRHLLGDFQGRTYGISYVVSDEDDFNKENYHYQKIEDNWYVYSKLKRNDIPNS